MDNLHDDDMTSAKTLRKWDAFDFAAVVMGVFLLFALACASVYGMRYSTVDEECVPGLVCFNEDGGDVLILQINSNMTATACFSWEQIDGSLKLAGATTDTILYQFMNIEIAGKPEIDDAIVFIRIPRSGLQGDLSGKWMIYFHSDVLRKDVSYWVYAYPNGTAVSNYRFDTNAIVQQDYSLFAWSNAYTWERKQNIIEMTSEEGILSNTVIASVGSILEYFKDGGVQVGL